jgi:hypothetical protein
MNGVSGSVLVALLIVVCVGPRRWAVLAMMVGVFFLTQGHSVEIIGLNLYPVRFLEVAALGRVMARRELTKARLNRLDALLLLLYNYAAIVWLLRSPTVSAQQFASGLDPTICFLAFRGLIVDLDDLRWLLKALLTVLLPFTVLVYVERVTGQSAFTVVGAPSELGFRNGVARCLGSFRHAILLGSVAASFLPLYISLWTPKASRLVAAVGVLVCLILVGLSNSGGPVTSTAAACLGWLVWPFRTRMHLVRRAIAALSVCLLLFMNAPIWYIPFKISGIVGGGGYHRGLLMDKAWQDLNEWWLAGMDITATASWAPYVHELLGGVDVTNQFLMFGLRAGLPAIAICITLLSASFIKIGAASASVRRQGNGADVRERLLWALGVVLFVHAVSWLGVSYFDQSAVIWLMQLAALSAAIQDRGFTEVSKLQFQPAVRASWGATQSPSPYVLNRRRRDDAALR